MSYLLIDNKILDFDNRKWESLIGESAFSNKFKEIINSFDFSINNYKSKVFILFDDRGNKLCYTITKNLFTKNDKFYRELNTITSISKEDLDIILKFNIDRRMNKLKNI